MAESKISSAAQRAFAGRLLAGILCVCAVLSPSAAQDKPQPIPNFSSANFGSGGDLLFLRREPPELTQIGHKRGLPEKTSRIANC
jgi:hypothetical protein